MALACLEPGILPQLLHPLPCLVSMKRPPSDGAGICSQDVVRPGRCLDAFVPQFRHCSMGNPNLMQVEGSFHLGHDDGLTTIS